MQEHRLEIDKWSFRICGWSSCPVIGFHPFPLMNWCSWRPLSSPSDSHVLNGELTWENLPSIHEISKAFDLAVEIHSVDLPATQIGNTRKRGEIHGNSSSRIKWWTGYIAENLRQENHTPPPCSSLTEPSLRVCKKRVVRSPLCGAQWSFWSTMPF
jgi:hypothetical protein